MNFPIVSIIIPVLNEAAGIVQQLARLRDFRAQGAEIIVVDGGSSDGSAERASALTDGLAMSLPGRGRQMNIGAARASGDIFLFLHADTRLPPSALSSIRNAISNGARWGRFNIEIEGSIHGLGMVAFMMNWRSRLTGIATGDQAIFVTREAFEARSGFPVIPLMEDIVFSDGLRKESPPACLKETVTTSGRRWEKHGLLRTILTMWWLRLRFYCGANPDDLAKAYGYVPQKN